MKKIAVLFFLFIFSTAGYCTSIPSDAWSWNTISVSKKITKRFSVGLEEELRLFGNMSRVNLFFTNVGVSYQVKSFKFSLYYRFINKNQDDAYFSKRHRLYFDAAYKYKFTKLSINYRVRFQGQIRDYYSSEYGRAVESYMRHKFDFSYNLKKYSPYLAAEFRYQFTNPGFPNANGLWNRMRYYAGVDYSFNKRHQVGVYYMIQHDFNNKRLENDFTIGLEYSLSL